MDYEESVTFCLTFLTFSIFMMILMFFSFYLKLKKERELSLLKQEREQELRFMMLNTQEFERERIAKDLHDSVGVMLSVAKLNIDIYQNQHNQENLQIALDVLNEATTETRRISHNMMPVTLSKFGLVAALDNLCLSIKKPKIFFHATDFNQRFDSQAEILIFRIAQEAINNLVRYAYASEAFVQIIVDKKVFIMKIEDNGQGFYILGAEKNMGLKSMYSRADILGAKLTIDSSQNKGTVILLEWDFSVI